MISTELEILFTAVWSGIVVYGSYTLIRCIRKVIPHKDWVISFEDFCFWVYISVYLFGQIFYTTSGNLRWYLVFGLFIGGFSAHIIWKSVENTYQKIKKALLSKK